MGEKSHLVRYSWRNLTWKSLQESKGGNFLMGKIWGNHISIYENHIESTTDMKWNMFLQFCRNKRKSSGLDLLFNSQLRKSSSPARCHLIHRRCGKAGGNLTHIASPETSSDSCPQKNLQKKKKTVYFIFIDSYSMLCQLFNLYPNVHELIMNWSYLYIYII